MGSSKTLGCLISTFRPDGNFILTDQQVAESHTDLTNVVYPISPRIGDKHLVDFEGDDWWVIYEFTNLGWVVSADISKGLGIQSNIAKNHWVDSDSDSLLSAPNDITRPYTTISDAFNIALAAPPVSATLEDITGNTNYYSNSYLPNADTIHLLGDNVYLSTAEVALIPTKKNVKLKIDGGLRLQTGAHLEDITDFLLDIKGSGYIYKSGDSIINTALTYSTLDIDLDSLYYKGNGIALNLSLASSITSIRFKNVYINDGSFIALPAYTNQGTNISIGNVKFMGGTVNNSIFSCLTNSIGTTTYGRKATNINIGSVSCPNTSMVSILDFDDSVYTNQRLNINVDQVEVNMGGKGVINYTGTTNTTGSNINININQLSNPASAAFISNDTVIDGDFTVNVNQNNISNTYAFSLTDTEIIGKLKFTGNYKGALALNYSGSYGGGSTIDIYMEGNYYYTNAAALYIADLVDNMTYNFYLNNCKFIGSNTALTIVYLTPGATNSVVNLICTNTKANLMGIEDARVTIIGDLTKNVNFK